VGNSFSYLALSLWPLLAAYLFFTQRTLTAVYITLIGGWLLLPQIVKFDVAYFPSIDKNSIPVLAVIFLATVVKGKNLLVLPRDRRLKLFLLLLLIAPLLTLYGNDEPVYNGARWIRALNLYDVLALGFENLIFVLPIVLGVKFVRTISDLWLICFLTFATALLYTLPALFEIRFSPQLHNWTYGFHPHSFLQQVRSDGFRPVVYVGHGLVVASFFFFSFCIACARFRSQKQINRHLYILLLCYLFVIVVLSKSLSATVLTVIGAILLMLGRATVIRNTTIVLLVIIFLYPITKIANIFPSQQLVNVIEKVRPERARSLGFRFFNEDKMIEKIKSKPLFGWGGWGRNRLENSVTDGFWLIKASESGLFGLYAFYGIIAFACYRLHKTARSLKGLGHHDSHALLGLSFSIAIYSLLLLPDNPTNPLYLFIIGASIGATRKMRIRVIR
jgi:hypothetical protein